MIYCLVALELSAIIGGMSRPSAPPSYLRLPVSSTRIADDAGDQLVSFDEQARQAGLAEGDGEGFYAWVRSCRINAAAYVHVCSQEGGGMVGSQEGGGSSSGGTGTGTLIDCDVVTAPSVRDDDCM